MTTKHTQGPWRLQFLGNQEADLISGGTFMGLTGGSGAPDKYEADDAAEWEANARLIAAAPDLLEACRAAKRLLLNKLEEPERTVFWKAADAIAKATKAEGPLAGLRDAESGATPTTP